MMNKKTLQPKWGVNGPSVEELTVLFGLAPKSADLFVQAFTHSSYGNEHYRENNERLEFLGDSVLGLIVANYLFSKFPNYREGQLSKLKAIIISAPTLAQFSLNMRFEQYLLLGEGESRRQGRKKENILADLFEAVIGAYFLNFDLDATRKFITPMVDQVLPTIIQKYQEIDAKTNLQEITQSMGLRPQYELTKEEGPPHERLFTVEVLLEKQKIGQGSGKSIKEAENKAAIEGIHYLQKSKTVQ